MDIASLGIKVESRGVSEAASDLDRLGKSGKTASEQLDKLGTTAKKTGKSFDSSEIAKKREELSKLIGQIDPTIAALDRLDQMEAKLRKASKQGLIDTSSFADYQKKIDQQREALGRLNDMNGKVGISAKQMAASMRGLPAQFIARWPWVAMLDVVRASVLVNMAFQLGVDGLAGFPNTLGLVKSGNYSAASTNMLASKRARQTPARAQRLARQMATGGWQ